MQLKGLVTVFATLLIAISLYQLHFTWAVHNHEGKMEAKAQNWVNSNFSGASQEAKDSAYNTRLKRLLDSTKSTTVTYGIGGATSYEKAKEQELSLGLDLQGGMSVTLEVELQDLLKSISNNPKDPSLNKALELASQRKGTTDADFIGLFAQAYKEVNPSGALSGLFANAGQRNIKLEDSDAQVISKLRTMAGEAFQNTFRVLTKRIDQFGVAQPNINPDPRKGTISVELAGVKDDPERVRKILQATANLQFWEVYSGSELQSSFLQAEEMLKKSGESQTAKGTDTTAKTIDSTQTASAPTDTTKTLSLGDLNKTDTATEATAAATPANTIIGLLQGAQQGEAALAYVATKDTALLSTNFETAKDIFPADVKFAYGIAPKTETGRASFVPLYALKLREGDKAPLEGNDVEESMISYDERSRPAVSLRMTKQGTKKWGDLTSANVNKPIAIVLDNVVYSAPNVINPILDGNSQISGSFSVEEASDLANILQSGQLAAPARIVQEQMVGPTLGAEAVKGGAMSFIISFVVIFALMLLYYNTSGWVANITLILNLLFTIGVLAGLGATLTSASIAALVLAIGMAVDTNVIIFERIKEEITWGRSYATAVDHGYNRSLPPILDAHVTTLLTAIILYVFGMGPIKGFATTQIIAVVLNLFCGILIARLVSEWWTNKKGRHFEYFTKLSKAIFKKAHFKFVESRRVAYGISVVVLLLGIGSFFYGFDEGVEYKGGRSYTVHFDQPQKEVTVKDALHAPLGEFPVVKTVGNNRTLNITTSFQKENPSRTADSLVEMTVFNGLKPFLAEGTTHAEFKKKYLQSSQSVQPSISEDLKRGAVTATIVSIILIFLYIFVRFRDWRFSLGTIISLVHDVFVTLAVFSFLRHIMPFPLEIDQHFIAAILTVVGFSMNDTVIVFDRIREYSKTMHGESKSKIINAAINDTLSRTIMTSVTVLIVVLVLFIFGGEVTRGFSFAMLIGVITGIYSSIFVAAPILVDFAKDKPLGKLTPEEIKARAKTKSAAATTAKAAHS
ncbi:protein translocase subunit SecDF [Terrimonas sp.]|uniref:protein translocase subunit SecDF n=1 Tax=Terrimonas sp. TaxID=1914338 RepID=UPI000D51EBF6|nr:protein translocase subunit SecDF [Terrimonas sp.]PVD50383.1 protein translocase subunit SecDF [Terrimonas sp.]